jgi:hypothetical protein
MHQFEISGASLRFTRNLAMYMAMPVYNHQFRLGVPGNQTISSNTENIHIAATILIQAQRGLILLCVHARFIGISHAAKSTPRRIFSPRFIGITCANYRVIDSSSAGCDGRLGSLRVVLHPTRRARLRQCQPNVGFIGTSDTGVYPNRIFTAHDGIGNLVFCLPR